LADGIQHTWYSPHRAFAAERLRGIEASGYATGTDATPAGAQRERRRADIRAAAVGLSPVAACL
jgi:hypothetical protein